MEEKDVTKSCNEKTPNFWSLLSHIDQKSYLNLKTALDSGCGKRNRGHRVEAFDTILDAIHRYAERRDDDDWKRFLVCGICWMEDLIAINTRQLRLLISKCKSSINGSLQKLGYSTHQSHSESWKVLFEKIPALKENYSELRQWTIRRKVISPTPVIAVAAPEGSDFAASAFQCPVQVTLPMNDFSQKTLQINLLIPRDATEGSQQYARIIPYQIPTSTSSLPFKMRQKMIRSASNERLA